MKNSILLLVAITVFALSFAPIFSLKTEVVFPYENIDTEDCKMNLSAVDGIVFMFDSFHSFDTEDIEDSRLYDKFEELCEDASSDDLDVLPALYKVAYRLNLQSEAINTNLAIVLTGVISLLYLLFTAAFLTVSIFNFITSFGKFTSKKDKLYNAAITMLAAVPSSIFILYGAFFLFVKLPSFMSLGIADTTKKVAMGGGAIASLVISMTAITAIVTLAFLSNLHKKKSNIAKRAVSLSLALLTICMCFAPIATTSVKTVFDGKGKKTTAEIPAYSSTFANYFLSKSEKEELEDTLDFLEYKIDYITLFEENFDYFSFYKEKDVEKGYANDLNTEFQILLNCVGSEYIVKPDLIALISLIFIIIIIASGMVMQQNLIYFMSGQYSKAQIKTAKIIALVFASITLAAVITYVILINAFANYYDIRGYGMSVAAGIILLAIFSIVGCCIPTKIKE